jgi:hypothetical protein
MTQNYGPITDDAVVESATTEKKNDSIQWVIKAVCPQISQYAQTLWKAVEDGEVISKGETYRVTLRQGSLKRDKTGDKIYDFYWDLVTWNDTAAPVSQPQAASNGTSSGGGSISPDEARRYSWPQAVNCAVHILSARRGADDPKIDRTDIREVAGLVYEVITAGPVAVSDSEPGAEPTPGATESDGEPPTPNVPMNYQALKRLNALRESYSVSVPRMQGWVEKQPGWEDLLSVRELDEMEIEMVMAAIQNGDIAADLKPAAAPEGALTPEDVDTATF